MDSIVKFTYIYILMNVKNKVSWELMLDSDTAKFWTFSDNSVIVHKSEIEKMHRYMVKNG